MTNEESDVTSIDNNDELSYIYYPFTAAGLSEGSGEAVLRTAKENERRGRERKDTSLSILLILFVE